MSSCHHIWPGAWRIRRKKLCSLQKGKLLVGLSRCVWWWELCLIPPYPPLSFMSSTALALSTKFSAFMVFSLTWRRFCFSKVLSPSAYLQSSNPVRIYSSIKNYSPSLADLSYPALLPLGTGNASGPASLPQSRTPSSRHGRCQDQERQFAIIIVVYRKPLY